MTNVKSEEKNIRYNTKNKIDKIFKVRHKGITIKCEQCFQKIKL